MRVYHREDELENHDRGLDYDLADCWIAAEC